MRWIAALPLMLTACAAASDSTGELGRARLAYADGWQRCERDCALTTPIASGATVFLWLVDEPRFPGAALRSEDLSIATVRPSILRDHFLVHGLRAGRTRLELVEGGEVIDRFPIEVRDVDDVGLAAPVQEPIRLTTSRYPLALQPHGGGAPLRGFGALEYQPSANIALDLHDLGDRSADLQALLAADSGTLSSELAWVWGDMSGTEGHVDAVAPSGARLRARFDVVAPEVRAIRLQDAPGDNAVHVDATFEPDDAPGLRACCEWSLAPAEAQLYRTREECRSVRVASTMPALPQRGVVTCRAYGVEASLAVEVAATP